jgi:hypothetical protein
MSNDGYPHKRKQSKTETQRRRHVRAEVAKEWSDKATNQGLEGTGRGRKDWPTELLEGAQSWPPEL